MSKKEELVRKYKKMGKDFVDWIWAQCKDVKTLILLGIVSLVIYSPALAGWALGIIFSWDWAWISATAYAVFWIGPFSPFFAIAVTITLAIKRWIEVVFRRKKQKEMPEGQGDQAEGAFDAENDGEEANAEGCDEEDKG